MRVAVKIALPEMPDGHEMFIISDEHTERIYSRGTLDLCLDNLSVKIKEYADEVVGGKFGSSNTLEELIDSLDILDKALGKR